MMQPLSLLSGRIAGQSPRGRDVYLLCDVLRTLLIGCNILKSSHSASSSLLTLSRSVCYLTVNTELRFLPGCRKGRQVGEQLTGHPESWWISSDQTQALVNNGALCPGLHAVNMFYTCHSKLLTMLLIEHVVGQVLSMSEN